MEGVKKTVWLAGLLSALLLVTLWMFPAWAQPVNLRYRFEPGSRFQATFLNTSPSQSNLTSLNRRTFEVKSVDPHGTATIEMSIDWAVTYATTPEGSTRLLFDTRTADSPVAPLLLHPVTLQIDPRGRILSVTGLEDGVLDDFYSRYQPVSEAERQAVDRCISALFSEEGIREGLVSYLFPEYPEGPVEAGATWSQTRKLDLETVRFALRRSLTFQGPHAETSQWRIRLEESAQAIESPDYRVGVDLEILSADGLYQVQPSTGMVQSFALQEEIRVETYEKQPDGARGAAIDSRTHAYRTEMDTGDRLASLLPAPDSGGSTPEDDFWQLIEVLANDPDLLSSMKDGLFITPAHLTTDQQARIKPLVDKISQLPESEQTMLLGQAVATFMAQLTDIASRHPQAQALLEASESKDANRTARMHALAKEAHKALAATTDIQQQAALWLAIGLARIDLDSPEEGKTALRMALPLLENDPAPMTRDRKRMIQFLKTMACSGMFD